MSDNSILPIGGGGGESDPIIDTENWTVKWFELGAALVLTITTAVFETAADVVAEAWGVIIRPIDAIGTLLEQMTSSLIIQITGSLNWAPAREIAETFGFVGSTVLMLIGLYGLSLVVRRVRDG